MGESESAGNIIRNILKRATAAKEATAALNIKNASYQIQSGDTLGGIAQRHGFDTDTLARYNNISNPNIIQAGQTLKFPSNATIPSKPTSSFQSQIPNLSEKSIGISDKNPAIGSRMQSSLQGAPTGVDHSFIRAREGYRNTGYIPRDKAGKILDSSGVTIGSGIDLGQWDERGLRQMDLSDRFIEQARPFLGVKGEAAQRVLDANPLHIPDERLREYSNRFINRYTSDVASRYNRSAQGGLKFEELPSQAQTVIASLLFQYGHEAPERKIPNAWRQVTTGDWQGLYNNLRDFGDKYPTRRNIEADYLKPILQGGSAAIQSFTPDQTVKSNSSLPANEDKTNTLTREEIPRTGPEAIVHALQHLDLDLMEKEAKDVIRSGKKTARPKAIYILNAIEGMKRNKIKPDDMLIRNVPVLPTEFRPFSVAGDTFIAGDANELYKDLINMRDSFQEGSDMLGYDGVADLVKPLYDSVKAVYGFGEPVNPKTRQRGVSGFLQKLSGSSPKYGYFQRRLISKTQDSVGRGVIIPDPDYGIDEIGIPEDMAWKTYMPYIQHRLVRRGLTPGEAFKAVTDRTGKARRELEAEMGERPVIYSRSPAWHKFSIMSANPRLVDGDSIRINTFITSGISGDFDGDCKSLFTKDLWKINDEIWYGNFIELSSRLDIKIPSTTKSYEIKENSIHVLSLQNGGSVWLPISHLHFRTKHNECRKVTSRSGFSLKTTDCHGIMIPDADLILKQVTPDDLTEGRTLIPVAHRIPMPIYESKLQLESIALDLDYDFGYVIGHYLGDGGAYDNTNEVRLMSNDVSHLETIKALLERMGLRHVPKNAGGKLKGWCILHDEIYSWFRENCGVKSDGKFMPSVVWTAPMDFCWGVLDGLISTDGRISAEGKSPACNIGIINRGLLESTAVMCRKLGVGVSWEDVAASKANHCKLHLRLSDLEDMTLTHPGREAQRASSCLWYAAKRREYLRVIPWPKHLRTLLMRDFGFLKKDHLIFASTYKEKEFTSLHVAQDFLSSVDTRHVEHPLFVRWVEWVTSKDIHFEVVEKVETIEREDIMVDVTVPETHLTVCPVEGIVTHQTVNFHVPSTPEAVQEAKTKLMPSNMVFSIRDHDKVMNPPKHEQILGLFSASNRPSQNRYNFNTEADALSAIQSGQVKLSDEISIGSELPGVNV